MDIEYLLWLQNFREATGNVLTPFLQLISDTAYTWLVLVPVIVYWCINKHDGLFLLFSMGISRFLNGIIKVTACAYRPFVRDTRIIPISRATGYSFPSGHTMWAAPICGGLAVLTRKKAAWFAWLCVLMIILTALARNYLGVHTPQDVVVGTLGGLLSVWLASLFMAHPEKENAILFGMLLLCAAGIVYVLVKPYPMDYVDGKLLVDPVVMTYDTFYAVGMATGLVFGRLLERKYIDFRITGLNFRGILLAVVGIVPYYLAVFAFAGKYKWIYEVLGEIFTVRGGRFMMGFIMMFWVTAVWPFVIKLTERRK